MTIKELKQLLKESENSLQVSKDLMRELGTKEATVYSQLKQMYIENDNKPFICTVDYLEYECSISATTQQRIIKKLQEQGYIEVKYKGQPQKRIISVLK